MDDLLNHAPCGFLSFGDDGTIHLANSTLLAMLGREHDDVVGHHIERILALGSRIFYQTHWFPLLRMQGRSEEIFMLLRTGTGEDIGVLVNAVRTERDGVVAYDCVLIHVRERQKYESELLRMKREAEQARAEIEVRTAEIERANELLETQAVELEQQQALLQEHADEEARLRAEADRANAAKSTFLAMMSHELRTPLNAISGYGEILDLGIHGALNPAQKDIVSRIGRAGHHLLELINDILDLSRIEAGHIEFHLQEIELERLVEDVTPLIEPQLASRTIAFDVRTAHGLRMTADMDKARQILVNLLGNAAKFTDAGGTVTMEAEHGDDGVVRIHVHDTGIGIPADQLEAVFQPFVQVESTHDRGAKGSGLGLAISRDLARGMGGDLTVASKPGEGSTFTLVLPATRAASVDA